MSERDWEKEWLFATIKSLYSKSWVYIIYLKPATSQLFSKQVRNFRLWARRLFVQSHINVKGGQLWFNLFPGAVVALLGTAYSPVLCLVPFKTCQAIAWALQRCASQTVRSQPAGPSPQAGSIPHAGKKNVDKIQMPLPPNRCARAKMDEIYPVYPPLEKLQGPITLANPRGTAAKEDTFFGLVLRGACQAGHGGAVYMYWWHSD